MRYLPRIDGPAGGYWLPMADHSAGALLDLLARFFPAAEAQVQPLSLAECLAGDPPLVVWLICQAGLHQPAWSPQSIADLAHWLEREALQIFAPSLEQIPFVWASTTPCRIAPPGQTSPTPEPERSSSDSGTSPPDWGSKGFSKTPVFQRQVARDLFRAHLAAQLATQLHPPLRAQAYFWALVHEAPWWFQLSSGQPIMASGILPGWLRNEAVGPLETILRKVRNWVDLLLPTLDGRIPSFEGNSCRTAPSFPTPPPFLGEQKQSPPPLSTHSTGHIKEDDSPFAQEVDCSVAYQQALQKAAQWAEALPGLPQNVAYLLGGLAQARLLECQFAEALEQAKLEALAELAAGAAHEINNPLSIISGRAQLLLQEETHPDRQHALAVILAQVRRIYEIIADFRLFARPPKPEFQSVELSQLVAGLLEEVGPRAAEESVELQRLGHPGPLEIQADPVQLQVALHAVVDNALEAVGPGGRIQIILEEEAAEVRIRVQDNGPGISPKVRQHLFDPFFSGRSAGRGVGLGLSKAWRIIVTNHHGRILVETAPGEGTSVELLLPKDPLCAAHLPDSGNHSAS